MTVLGGWESFCVIVGSSAGAVIGLQFLVVRKREQREAERDR